MNRPEFTRHLCFVIINGAKIYMCLIKGNFIKEVVWEETQ